MIDINIIILLIWLHFIADFVMQTDYVAKSKSSSNSVLLYHVTIYSVLFCFISIYFAAINLLLHFVTDWCTSRATTYLWQRNQRHWFFVVIGIDQAVHMTCLLVTYHWLHVYNLL